MDLITNIKGVGPKTLTSLNSLGIYNLNDLINYYPFRYNLIKLSDINNIKDNENIVIEGVIENYPSYYRINKRLDKMTFRVNSNNQLFTVTIFNRGFLKSKLLPGNNITIIGKYEKLKNTIIASDIKLKLIGNEELIEPIYHSSNSISSTAIKKIIENINIEVEEDPLPLKIKNKYNFIDKTEALINIHKPKNKELLTESIRRFKYEEALIFFTKLEELKNQRIHKEGIKREVDYNLVEKFILKLPFELTSDQEKAVKEIYLNLNNSNQSNILLQGDVGSGKTIVAIISMYINYLSGYQSAMMVPTDVLAKQHLNTLNSVLKDFNINIKLLTGKMNKKEQQLIQNDIKEGKVNIIIGTHALISDKVTYNNLGLVITDEQHRFGVNQRDFLKEKGNTPDVIYMSATPIPRTYALTLYNDMQVINIHTKPKGRLPIITEIKNTSEIKEVLELMYDQLKQNHQVYVIAPLIEESEKIDLTNINDLEEKMNKAFGKLYKIGVMHGKMTSIEKDEIMDKFQKNELNILISTTVIEVGVDVSNATTMVIFDSFRFGLSTLHQLRGRIGRSDVQSYCILISDLEKERLNVLKETNDGFLISEADFKLRGSGDLFGVRQSGQTLFKLLDIHQDFDIILNVKDDIKSLFL
jgi:ATP-dependent DNA helicase RecG